MERVFSFEQRPVSLRMDTIVPFSTNTVLQCSVHNVFRSILTTNETITRFLLNYKTATCTSSSIDRAKAHGSAEQHPIIYLKHNKFREGWLS